MKIRSINVEEIDRFVKFSDYPTREAIERDKKLIRKMWAEGLSRPEWFFLAEQNGQPVGRAAYWRLRARPEEMHLIFFKLPWKGGYLDTGLQILLESWERLRVSGAQYVARKLNSHWKHLDEQREIFDLAGMVLLQEKQGFLWRSSSPVSTQNRLTFRSLAQVGEANYIEAIRRVSIGVVDREIQAMGGEKAAAQLNAILKEDSVFKPEWAQLAYDPAGELVGLVAPVGASDTQDEGSIGYIGVVPEKRGRGYIHDLLAKGLQVLQAAGMKEVYSETESENRAMRRAFARFGCKPVATVWYYHRKL